MARTLIPPPLQAHFQSAYQTVAWCWALKLSDGTWEGYTSLEHDLEGVAYTAATNGTHEYLGGPWQLADVPQLTYASIASVVLTSQPSRLNLGANGIDATTIAVNREKLLSGAYNDAEFEAWRCNYLDLTMGRDVRISGTIDNRKVGGTLVTFALAPWPSKADATFSRVVGPLCDVGIYPGESFGTGRCRNQTLADGPARAAWSVTATVTAATSSHEVTVSFGAASVAGPDLNSQFANRLPEGDAEFTSGACAGAAKSIKSATLNSGDAGGPGVVSLVLHQELPAVPAVGDTLTLVAGCKRTFEDCQFFSNTNNFQGFNLVPGREGVMRQYGT